MKKGIFANHLMAKEQDEPLGRYLTVLLYDNKSHIHSSMGSRFYDEKGCGEMPPGKVLAT